MENSDSFRCGAKLQNKDVVRAKCSDQYKKQYNKSGIPVYGFVIANFSLIVTVCVIYSQLVKPRVDEVERASRCRADAESQNNDDNRPKPRLFVAYFCQLSTRFAIGIIFIVLQTQVLYPDNFPSNFHCQIAAASDAASVSTISNIQNSTMYECYNEQATKKTSWMNAVIVGNVVLALIILIEIICILALRVKKGKEFFEDSQFHAAFLLLQEQPSLRDYIVSLKKSIRYGTEEPSDLKAVFQEQHGEGKRNKDLKLDQIYTNLVLIPNRAEHDFTGKYREEQLKVYPPSKKTAKPISREKIIDGESKKILVVGRPGIGKTLFLTKWIRDWALDIAFNNFDFLFFLKFRKFNSDETPLSLRDLLSRSEYSETERLSDQVWSHVLTKPEKVLIFFDGLDEFLNRSKIANAVFCNNVENQMPLSKLYYNIVKGNLLRGATVLTTTRPSAMDEVRGLHFEKTIEILGFASEQVEEYVENFAKHAVENVEDAGKKIWEHIKTNMNIFSLCYIPVNCLIICSCLLQILKFQLTGVDFPTTLTEIYQRYVKIFFFRHDEHREDLRREDINSKDLPPEVEKKIKPLAKLAFDGLTQKRLIFGQKEVPEDLVNCAVFHRLPDSRHGPFTYEAQYCFIHLTMQEFFAAKHITETMKGKKLRAFIANHIKNGEWQLVLQFVAGLLGEQSIKIFTDLLPKTTEEEDERQLMDDPSLERRTVTCWPTRSEKYLALTLLKCIQETNESGSVVQSKLEEIGFNAVDFSQCHLAPADCTAVVHFIKRVQQISLINLSNNNIGSLACVEIVKLFDNTNCQLRGLNLWGNDITDAGVKQLSSVLANSQLSSLNLSGNDITVAGVKQLSSVLANSQLRSLNLMGNGITDAGVKQLSSVLANSQLSSLDLWRNGITDAGVKQLSSVLANSQLSSLNLGGNGITDAGVKQLSSVLANSQLSSLDLGGNGITDAGVKQLSSVLANSQLSSLDLSGNGITDAGVKQLSSVLANSQLRSLNLIGNGITDAGVKQLSSVLANSQLSSLNLGENGITDAGVKQLSSVLANSQLRSLNLIGNGITDAGVKQLSSVLANSQLSSLNLGGNGITDAGVKQLSSVLANSQLSSLNLGENGITDAGVKQLSSVLANSQLSSLNLSDNDITDAGVEQLSSVLANSQLSSLNLGENYITNKARAQIRQANPNCKVSF